MNGSRGFAGNRSQRSENGRKTLEPGDLPYPCPSWFDAIEPGRTRIGEVTPEQQRERLALIGKHGDWGQEAVKEAFKEGWPDRFKEWTAEVAKERQQSRSRSRGHGMSL